jgi:hypothetical protein
MPKSIKDSKEAANLVACLLPAGHPSSPRHFRNLGNQRNLCFWAKSSSPLRQQNEIVDNPRRERNFLMFQVENLYI